MVLIVFVFAAGAVLSFFEARSSLPRGGRALRQPAGESPPPLLTESAPAFFQSRWFPQGTPKERQRDAEKPRADMVDT